MNYFKYKEHKKSQFEITYEEALKSYPLRTFLINLYIFILFFSPIPNMINKILYYSSYSNSIDNRHFPTIGYESKGYLIKRVTSVKKTFAEFDSTIDKKLCQKYNMKKLQKKIDKAYRDSTINEDEAYKIQDLMDIVVSNSISK